MCKDKWNSLNSSLKKLAFYHKGTNNHTSLWDLSFYEEMFPFALLIQERLLWLDWILSRGKNHHCSSTYQGCKC
jgi:hypothetical protein